MRPHDALRFVVSNVTQVRYAVCMDETTAAFVADMQTARAGLGWSQDRVAREATALGGAVVNQMTVSRIEAGTREPRLAEALVIAAVLDFQIAGVQQDRRLAEMRATIDRAKAALDGDPNSGRDAWVDALRNHVASDAQRRADRAYELAADNQED